MKTLLLILAVSFGNNAMAQDLNLDLLDALHIRDEVKISELLKKGASMSSNRVKDSLLGLAHGAASIQEREIAEKNLDLIKFYILKGADINAHVNLLASDPFSSEESTALVQAVRQVCSSNKVFTVSSLLDMGADPEIAWIRSYTRGGSDSWKPLDINRSMGFSFGSAECHHQVETLLLNSIQKKRGNTNP
ncbi:MAG: hypothetical protein KA715_02060 [Xanthomonadaceae bacterium]|nr:hypothetical protein [Xanthomonadaceae bacterium]